MLRPDPGQCQIGCVRHSAGGEEGVLRFAQQRRAGGAPLGQSAAGVRRNADHNGLREHTADVLQVATGQDGRARGAQARDVAQRAQGRIQATSHHRTRRERLQRHQDSDPQQSASAARHRPRDRQCPLHTDPQANSQILVPLLLQSTSNAVVSEQTAKRIDDWDVRQHRCDHT